MSVLSSLHACPRRRGIVELKILIDGPESNEDLSSLYQWLSRDPKVKRAAEVTMADAAAQTGAMGLDAASLNAIVGDLLGAGSLIMSILSWKDSHSKPPTVRIEHGEATQVIEGNSPEAIRSMLEALDESAPETPNYPDLD
jgi:hypothetical protein